MLNPSYMKKQKCNKFSVFHCNVRSLRRNLNNLVTYIARLDFGFDIIALSETWLKADETFSMQGFRLLSQPRNSRARGGGVALFIRDNNACNVLLDASVTNATIETLFIKMERGPVIGVVYRPPGSSIKAFLKEFESVLMRVSCMHYNIIVVVGD